MLLTSRLEKAISVALTIHAKQKRKGDNLTPYATHPILVAMLLSKYTDDEDVVVAGLLHDALEDTKYSREQIKKEFGEKVLSIVEEVSDKDPKASWDERKMNYLVNIPKKSKEACLVSCADKVHNLNSLTALYQAVGDALEKRFNAPMGKKIWFYEQIYKAMKLKFRHGLIRELHHALEEFHEVVSKKPPKKRKSIKRFIGPYDLVRWQHFSAREGNDLYLVDTFEDSNKAGRIANKLTMQAREEAAKDLTEGTSLTLKDLWDMSYSFGVYDAAGQVVYWADWFTV